jgi:hypothetical protein
MKRTLNGDIIDELYAGEQQDIFVLSILGTKQPGTFLDIGCCYHENQNGHIIRSNSALLEKHGWSGIGIDLRDLSENFNQHRPNTKFINSSALDIDYKELFEQNVINSPIDYLSIDLDGAGLALSCLEKVLNSGYEFKVATIEHDAYRGMVESDTKPTRLLMQQYGYVLVRECNIIEDFWINPNYISKDQYEKFIHVIDIKELGKSDDNKDTHFWKYCSDINHDFTKFYI